VSEPHLTLSGTLAGRYAIEREIGRGGMAVVYLARDLRHDTNVAVKVLNPELAARVGAERFSREIRITASLQHPSILSVFDSGEVAGLPFCVMPYVEGETLEARLRREGALPVEDAVAIASDVADGLAYAHAQGFVHRDVKPSNILLSHGRARLADFGIARAVDAAGQDRLTTAGLAVGTAAYMSPEQASDKELDGRSDVYSLGCVLYEMLAGDPPYSGTSARAILARHLADTIPSLRAVRDTVPPALEAAIVRAMAKLPADRFAGAEEFRNAIRQAATGAIEVPAPRSHTRRIGVTAAAVVAVAALAVVLARGGFGPGPALDANRIMVFPLAVSEGFPGSASTGEDVATLIGTTLDGTGPLRWIDGWTQLDPARRQNVRELSAQEARALAHAQRCAFYVTGTVIRQNADSALISLTLFDTREGTDVGRSSATAPLGEAWRGVLAVNELLPQLIPGATSQILAEWTNRPPLAIANFLLGEAAFRRIRLAEALDLYRAAVAADSAFAFAALRGAQAASWSHRNAEAAALIETAMRQPLPPRYAAFARGYRSYLEGRADSAIAAFRAALALDPDMAVTWLQLGETWTHLLPLAGSPDDSALDAFQHVTRIDSSAAHALFHPIQILVRRGDTASAGRLFQRMAAASPEGDYEDQAAIMIDCARSGVASLAWDDIARDRPFPLYAASAQMSGGGAQAACAAAGFAALLRADTAGDGAAAGRRFFALLGLHSLLLAQGHADEAVVAVDSFYARWGSGASLFVLAAPYYDSHLERARAVARREAAESGAAYGRLPFGVPLWELGVLEARRGSPEVAAAVAAELRNRSAGGRSRADSLRAASIEAHLALAAGDTGLALRRFAALVPAIAPGDTLRYDESEPLGGERLEYARLLAARGEDRRALEIANVFDSAWPVVYPLYLVPSLRLRAEAAEAMGDARLATQFRARIEALQGRPAAER
jgi:serine/threonine-protein kinase